MKIYKKYLFWLFAIIIIFFLSLFILRHSWQISLLETNRILEIYPRFSFIVLFTGNNAALLFSILLISSLFFALLVSEILLRISGYHPMMISASKHFKSVDELKEYKGFSTDEFGIFKIDSIAANEISNRIRNKNHDTNFGELLESFEVYRISLDYSKILLREIENSFSKYFFKLKSINQRNDFENAVIEYVNSPINSDGFRSVEFKKYENTKPSVLLLGDSFTWGHTTKNKTNSFADILLSKGYTVYNTGITGTDVAQYLAIAKKYIPILKPDFVIVNFYLGNDITYYKREPNPHIPVFYATNAGNLLSCPHGKYFKNKRAAYRIALANYILPINENIPLDIILLKTTIGTQLRHFIMKSDIIPYITMGNNNELNNYYNEVLKNKYPTPYSNQELLEIKEISECYNSKFILSSIPEVYFSTKKTTNDFSELFGGIKYIEMEVNKSDYNLFDGHFNDKGHKKYAEFLEKLID